MSYSKRERGEYIRLKMHGYILYALGKGEINAEQAGDIFDLISDVETAGTPKSKELANHQYYLKAVAEWVMARELMRQRFSEK